MVELRDLTADNWYECTELKVAEAQKGFVRANVFTIAQAQFYPWLKPQAVYVGDELVGLVLYMDQPEDPGEYWFIRLMIDERFQGKGYGRQAAAEVLNRLVAKPDCKAIFLSHEPANTSAVQLYQSLGFKHTGDKSGTQLVMRLDVRSGS